MPLLFSRVSIFDVLQHQQEQLRDEVNELTSSAIDRVPEDELVRDLAAKFKFEIPVLEEDNAHISYREVDVDVSQDQMRMIWDRSKPFYLKGTEITISVPFKGHPELFLVRPQTFSTNPPRGEIHGHEIRLIQTRTDDNAAAAKAEFQRSIQNIKQNLEWLEGSIKDFNSKIGSQVQSLVAQRRQKLAATASMVASIGLPVKEADSAPAQFDHVSRNKALGKSLSSPKKWDVFISHASEDKDEFVRPLVNALKSRGISVWFDEFTLKIGDSLRTSIDYGLANSRYGVVVLSKNFFAKHWPLQELNGLAAREVKGKNMILPIWHKVNFEEVCEFSPTLADKLAASSDVGINKLVNDITQVLQDQD